MTYLVGVVVSGVVRLGPLRLSAYGLCAAVGLVGALWLSLRTARMVEIEPAEIWDAGLFGLGAAFVLSRLLLVVRNWPVFLHYPMLVLALPSLSYWGMGLTAAAVAVYLRVKKLSLLAVMDAWAPCAALLAGFLELGHWLEGSDAGMPWRRGGGLLPAQEFGLLLSVALMVGLLWRLALRRRVGEVGALGLVLGGLAAFLVSIVTEPTGDGWLESRQWIAIGAMIVGVFLRPIAFIAHRIASAQSAAPPTRAEVAEMLERWASGQPASYIYDHEKIEYGEFDDPTLIELKKRWPDLWEGPHHGDISADEQNRIFLDYARRLRAEPTSKDND